MKVNSSLKLKHSIALSACLFVLPCCVSSAAQAEGENSSAAATPQTKSKIYKFSVNGVTSFSDIAPMKQRYVIWKPDCYACSLTSSIDWYSTKLHLEEFSNVISTTAARYRVDPALVRALIHAESGFNPKARSNKGAMGLMQLMPTTAREMGVRDASVPTNNIQGGVQYLAGLLNRFKGDIALAAAAYNAGPAAVEKYAGIPPYAETQTYVKRVKILHQRYAQYRETSF